MTIRTLILAGLLALVSTAQAQAGFTVSIGNATLNQGGTVTLDVTISGSDRLDLFFGEFVLTPLDGAPAGGVRFSATPPLPPLSDANYAFAPDNSFAIANLPSNPASVYTTTSLNDTYLVSDATLDGAGVDVSGGKLLARLTLEAGTPAAGTRYLVSYGASSWYQNESGEEVPVTFLGGEIVVAGPVVTAVPAPVGLSLVLSGLFPLLLWGWIRRQV